MSHNLKVGRQEQVFGLCPNSFASSKQGSCYLGRGQQGNSYILGIREWHRQRNNFRELGFYPPAPISQASCLGPKGSLMPSYKTWGNPHSWSLRDRKHFQLRITNTVFSMTKRPVTDSLEKLRILFGKRENVLSHLWMLLVTNIILLPSPYSISLSLNTLS